MKFVKMNIVRLWGGAVGCVFVAHAIGKTHRSLRPPADGARGEVPPGEAQDGEAGGHDDVEPDPRGDKAAALRGAEVEERGAEQGL